MVPRVAVFRCAVFVVFCCSMCRVLFDLARGVFVNFLCKPFKNDRTDRDAVRGPDLNGSTEPCITWGSLSPKGKGNFWGLSDRLKTIGSICCCLHKKAEPI